MALTVRDLVERRVPQYLAIYLGAGWGLIEFCSFLEGRFSLSPDWTNLILFAWALLIPSVILFTYFHGRPGRDRITRPVMIGIPANVVIALLVLGAASGGADLSATTTEITVTDEAGNEVERRVANAAHRKRLAVFDFEPSSDTSIAWLTQGAPMALSIDLAQDIFLDLRTSAHFREKLREAGVPAGGSAPLALKRQIATELHLPFFLAGSVSRTSEGTTVRVELYETSSGQMIRERVSTSTDVLRAIDELTVQLKSDLGLPNSRPGGVQDLPVASLLSTDVEAFRALAEGQSAAMRDDWPAAQRGFERAVSRDSSFALAHYSAYQARLLQGDAQGSIPSLDAAMRHLYRMPERLQFLVKADHYFMRQDMEKAFAVVGMMTELYPDDIQGHNMRAQFQILRNDLGNAIASLRRILELDPGQHEMLLQIGSLQEQKGDYEDAIATYEQYAAQFPDDAEAHLRVARAYQRVGDMERAKTSIDRALVIDPTHIAATLDRAILHRNMGELERAERLLNDAASLARTAEDRTRLHAARQTFYEFTGQTARMFEAMDAHLAAVAEHQPPVTQANTRMAQLGRLVQHGRMARARAQLDEVRSQLNAPLNDFWHIGQLEIAIAARDTVELPEAIAGVTRVMQQFNFAFLAASIARGQAALAEGRGDWDAALSAYRSSLELDPDQSTIHRDIARALRHLGQLEEATEAVQTHLRRVPFAPESNLEAARIRLAAGDTAAARAHLERAAAMLVNADASHASALEVSRTLESLR